MNRSEHEPQTATEVNQFVRLPGLFRRWEIEQIIDVGADFHIEEAGTCCDGTPLMAVYRRDHPAEREDGSGECGP